MTAAYYSFVDITIQVKKRDRIQVIWVVASQSLPNVNDKEQVFLIIILWSCLLMWQHWMCDAIFMAVISKSRWVPLLGLGPHMEIPADSKESWTRQMMWEQRNVQEEGGNAKTWSPRPQLPCAIAESQLSLQQVRQSHYPPPVVGHTSDTTTAGSPTEYPTCTLYRTTNRNRRILETLE